MTQKSEELKASSKREATRMTDTPFDMHITDKTKATVRLHVTIVRRLSVTLYYAIITLVYSMMTI